MHTDTHTHRYTGNESHNIAMTTSAIITHLFSCHENYKLKYDLTVKSQLKHRI